MTVNVDNINILNLYTLMTLFYMELTVSDTPYIYYEYGIVLRFHFSRQVVVKKFLF